MLVKCWVPEALQEQLWEHTRRLREEREIVASRLELERLAEERRAAQKFVQRRKSVVRAKGPGLFGIF